MVPLTKPNLFLAFKAKVMALRQAEYIHSKVWKSKPNLDDLSDE